MATQRMQVGLSLGPSFAELCAILPSGDQILFQERIYRPKESLKSLFSRLKNQHPEAEIKTIAVSLRALEKIFPTRLGGSVAQIVTQGFESWATLRQPLTSQHLSQRPLRTEALASQELVFGISERTNAQGEIQISPDVQAMKALAEKLKVLKVERLCLNLLFAHRNPANENRLKDYFESQGFEVFCASRNPSSTDEVPAWRKNILNACLAGSWNEILKEIQEASLALGPEIQIHFLKHKGKIVSDLKNEIVDALFGWTGSFPSDKKILHLGLEKWSLVDSTETAKWNSPWGLIEVEHRKHRDLSAQPTCLIAPDLFQNLKWNQELGFEPGPMSLGRAQKPLLADFLFTQNSVCQNSLGNLVQDQGQQRFHESFKLLQKNQSPQNLMENLVESMSLHLDSKPWILSGFWAPVFEKALKQKFPKSSIEVLSPSQNESFYAAKSL